ncbi:putative DNA-binding domain [Dillenia turbinata]|uniref:KAT8 regulatory NSL complex subunit 2 n=1 Tax=Dillenia turbinata TaxID=194707 RepID=A0AAN8UAE8_9MAGN
MGFPNKFPPPHPNLAADTDAPASAVVSRLPPTTSHGDTKTNENPNPNPTTLIKRNRDIAMSSDHNASSSSSASPFRIAGSEEDSILSNSVALTRQEVLRRRSRRIKQLVDCYKNHYWALMEELRFQYRQYYWNYGKSPFKTEQEEKDGQNGGGVEVIEENGNGNGNGNTNSNSRLGLGSGDGDDGIKLCAVTGCKSKAMALTDYCHPHILFDKRQVLYKPCNYVIKSAQSGPVLCGKPILKSSVPSLCPLHFQKAEKHVTRALKRAGLNNISSSSKLAPKFHVVVAEYVRQIQAKRRQMRRTPINQVEIKEEKTNKVN